MEIFINSQIYDLIAFKLETKETLERGKGKESITDSRITRWEDSVNDLNRYISGVDPRGSVDKDELLKLLANKAERDMDDKWLLCFIF